MNTLRQLANSRRLPAELAYDVALQLCRMIPDNDFRGVAITPDAISVDDNGLIRFSSTPEPVPDLSFCPPEYISGQPMQEDQYWFSVAMLIYWMLTGKSGYQLLPDGVMAYLRNGCQTSPFQKLSTDDENLPVHALRCLSSVTPNERNTGFPELLNYMLKRHPGTAKVNYTLSGQTLDTVQIRFSSSALDVPLNGSVTLNGTPYTYAPQTLSYRPGVHSYTITLTAARTTPDTNVVKYGLYTLKSSSDSEKLGDIGGEGFTRIYPIKLAQTVAYPLAVFKTGTGRPKLVKSFRFTIPANPREGEGQLVIKVPQNSTEVTITVLDKNRTRQLIEPIKVQLL